jgi:hypothetical protein
MSPLFDIHTPNTPNDPFFMIHISCIVNQQSARAGKSFACALSGFFGGCTISIFDFDETYPSASDALFSLFPWTTVLIDYLCTLPEWLHRVSQGSRHGSPFSRHYLLASVLKADFLEWLHLLLLLAGSLLWGCQID